MSAYKPTSHSGFLLVCVCVCSRFRAAQVSKNSEHFQRPPSTRMVFCLSNCLTVQIMASHGPMNKKTSSWLGIYIYIKCIYVCIYICDKNVSWQSTSRVVASQVVALFYHIRVCLKMTPNIEWFIYHDLPCENAMSVCTMFSNTSTSVVATVSPLVL